MPVGSQVPLPLGVHYLTFTPDDGYTVDPVPGGGTWNPLDGTVTFRIVLVAGTDGGAARVTTTKAPSITGTAQVGKTLTANIGTFNPGAAKVTYQWLANGAAIAGATARTYTPANAAQVGKKLSVRVTATLAEYTTYTGTSAQTVAVKAGTLTAPVPTVVGTTAVGQTLTAKPGTWTTGAGLKYQWYVSGAAIKGATKATFKLTTTQRGKLITLKVTGSKAGYTTVTKASAARGVVTAGLVAGATPRISGTPKVGVKLTAVPGTWTAGAKLSYRWYANGVAISGATKTTFVPSAPHLGKRLTVKVTGAKAGWSPNSRTSNAAAKVALGALKAPNPAISGPVAVGQTLTVKPATWTSGTKLTYQWLANNTAIPGATAATFKLTSAQHGATIRVRVTGTKPGYATAAKLSASTAKVATGVVSGTVPKISGAAKVGVRLTAVPGTWKAGTASPKLSYQWYASGKAIPGATAPSFVPTAAQYQKTMTVRVTGTRADYVSVMKQSAATSKVAKSTQVQPKPTAAGQTNPGDSKNCDDFATQALAQAWFNTYFPRFGDVARLDGDGDGIACEARR